MPCRSRSASFCIAGLLAAALLLSMASAAIAQQPQRAPLNPAFEEWVNGQKSGDYAGYVPTPWQPRIVVEETPGAVGTKELPTSYDLRTAGHVTPVRDQGNCGSCWTFSTYASAESWLLKNRAETWDFSENHLKNYAGFDLGPCNGGNEYMSCAYMARGDGPVLEVDDPYYPGDNRPSPGGPKVKVLESMLLFPDSASIKNALMTYGALSTSMCYDGAYFNSGDNTYYYNDLLSVDHAVTIVGWDDNKVVTGGSQPDPPAGAWIIKNSWNTTWGESGYFYISYYDTSAVVPVGGAFLLGPMEPPATYGRIYQHDDLGACAWYGYLSTPTPGTCWGANVFTAQADEDLAAVAFYTEGPNTTYTVYVYNAFTGSTPTGLLGSKSGTIAYAGYHTIALDTPIALTSGDPFALVLRVTTPGAQYPMAAEEAIADYSSLAVVNTGESYFSADGEAWSAAEDFNICLKGITAVEPAGTVDIADSILPAGDLALPFPELEMGQSLTENLVVQNIHAENDLTVNGISLLSAAKTTHAGGFVLRNLPSLPTVVAPGNSISFDVEFRPTWFGSFEDSLVIETNDIENRQVTIALTGSATAENVPVAGAAGLALLALCCGGAALVRLRKKR